MRAAQYNTRQAPKPKTRTHAGRIMSPKRNRRAMTRRVLQVAGHGPAVRNRYFFTLR